MDVSASKQLKELSAIYNEAVYGKSPESIEAKRRKDDDLAGSPNKKGPRFKVGPEDKKAGTEAWKRYKAGNPNYGLREGADWTEEDYVVEGVAKKEIKDLRKAAETGKGKYVKKADELQEKKQKDTPDQVKAVIAYDKARKATDDATYDSEHGDKKQAKKEKDYAKWQRDTGARDAQKSGHPWEHAKGSTREKEGKKSEKHAHVKDSFEPSENITRLAESGRFSVEELWKIVEVEEGYQRNPEKGEEEERKAEKRRKASGAMPPRGDKRREDFEKWYAANVR